ncbi:MAG: FAD/NAD(P)-binding protein [Pseudomonadota bacterium]
MSSIRHVAIVGAGFSGTTLAIALLRAGLRVSLVERAAEAGLGVAYSTRQYSHLLNVRSGNMGAFADDPAHFAGWLAARGGPEAAQGFAPRATYGEYVRELLAAERAAAGERLRIIHDEAVDLTRDNGVTLTFTRGETLAADAAVLAIGNLPPATPPGLGGIAGSPGYWPNPWQAGLTDGLTSDDAVLLIGTGLTTIDTILSLEDAGFAGRIVALSRRGLTPQRHEPAGSHPARDGPPAGQLSAMTRDVRRHADQSGWRGAVDALRPYTQGIWAQASLPERSRFLRHLRPWWDVHRHRIAPEIGARIDRLSAAGRLTILSGKLTGASAGLGGIAVGWRRRGGTDIEHGTFRRVVNCTGPAQDVGRTTDPLLAALVERGAIRPDGLRIGIDVDAADRAIAADGSRDDQLFAIGPMTRGTFWEIVAVPDIRGQVRRLAKHLAG